MRIIQKSTRTINFSPVTFVAGTVENLVRIASGLNWGLNGYPVVVHEIGIEAVFVTASAPAPVIGSWPVHAYFSECVINFAGANISFPYSDNITSPNTYFSNWHPVAKFGSGLKIDELYFAASFATINVVITGVTSLNIRYYMLFEEIDNKGNLPGDQIQTC